MGQGDDEACADGFLVVAELVEGLVGVPGEGKCLRGPLEPAEDGGAHHGDAGAFEAGGVSGLEDAIRVVERCESFGIPPQVAQGVRFLFSGFASPFDDPEREVPVAEPVGDLSGEARQQQGLSGISFSRPGRGSQEPADATGVPWLNGCLGEGPRDLVCECLGRFVVLFGKLFAGGEGSPEELLVGDLSLRRVEDCFGC